MPIKLKQTVFVAMSGGVDSSVTAALLKESGFNVRGVYLQQWSETPDCPCKEDIEYIEQASKQLGIPYEVWDKRKEYKRYVIDYFLKEYKQGRTPNPDVMCNTTFKFGTFLKEALEKGADFIATGHYARISRENPIIWDINSSLSLVTAIDPFKDQTYFLGYLNKDQVKHSIMPIGWLPKKTVRELARYFGLKVAKRKDSQGICFLGDIDMQTFLSKYLQIKRGDIIDIKTNQEVGTHLGVWFYTIGQRRGLGIGGAGIPYYVVAKDTKRNILYVAKGRENKYLLKKRLILSKVTFVTDKALEYIQKRNLQVWVMIRYRSEAVKSKIINLEGDTLIVESVNKPFWAPAPGQFAVLYSTEAVNLCTIYNELFNRSPKEIPQDLLSKKLQEKLTNIRNSPVLGAGVIESVN